MDLSFWILLFCKYVLAHLFHIGRDKQASVQQEMGVKSAMDASADPEKATLAGKDHNQNFAQTNPSESWWKLLIIAIGIGCSAWEVPVLLLDSNPVIRMPWAIKLIFSCGLIVQITTLLWSLFPDTRPLPQKDFIDALIKVCAGVAVLGYVIGSLSAWLFYMIVWSGGYHATVLVYLGCNLAVGAVGILVAMSLNPEHFLLKHHQ